MPLAEGSERPGARVAGADAPDRGAPVPRRPIVPWLSHHLAPLLIAVVGLGVTGTVTGLTHASYANSEQRMATLQAQLTQSALSVGPVDLERRLGRTATVASLTNGSVPLFESTIATTVSKTGPLTTAALFELTGDHLSLLATAGSTPAMAPGSPHALQFAELAARTPTLVVERLFRPGLQRFAYALAVAPPDGGPTFITYGEQAFPPDRRIAFPATNPDSSLNFAVYFGHSTAPGALVESTGPVPIPGPVATELIPFGDKVLTLAVSPRTSLMGALAPWVPWIILALGLLFTLCAVTTAEWLARRRRSAERRADVSTSLYRRQREASETLQQALLPPELPWIDGFEVAARYRSGSAGFEVGGDWYDVVAAGGSLFFSVGDVAGRGAEAAVVMAQLRLAINAFGFHGADPATALTKVAPMVDFARHGRFATVLCGQIHPESGTMLLANAGHTPPVVVSRGTASVVELPADEPLGVGSIYRTHRVVLGPGDTFLAVTDGLVERRDETIDDGLARLCLHAANPLPLDSLLDAILDALVPEGPHDDIAMLAIRRSAVGR
ncbi:MAG: PP2C family protein-serine/threonine phosphatase [Acidimicrobiales bacterium]